MTISHAESAVAPTAVDAALRGFFAERRAEAEHLGQDLTDTIAELEDYVLGGGKRIRPLVAWLGWIGAGGDPAGPVAPAVLRACAGFELLHVSGLIHDDIIDASLTRRGRPAAHVTFAERHRSRRYSGDPAAYGTGAAILIGDVALVWADYMIRTSGLPADVQAGLGQVWSAVRSEVLYGQLLDLNNQASEAEDVESALRVNRYKTASYTVQRPLQFGAVLAGANADLVAAYRAFGADIGMAFQLRDDLLGVFGDPEVTGKPSGDDLREGKRTVLLATALRRADEHDPGAAAFLREKVGTDLSQDELARVRGVLLDVGAVRDIEQQIEVLTDHALAVLEASGTAVAAKEQLAELAIRATQRAR
ncbi:polyprenyl synthetase family protein [Actinocorallia sp. API 0066]|uniref:polyprenyl synthetase family protein n=1 Tax=Actinocorallia sp. API 0066 TaxID=2896846 RepID=UPI001E2EF56D|nr:polyprenyl synthetase family protein [Actinocorallia sp. API 0066]MCD0448644.1 polyprenyl synthetase family protein [Actinocorallia sp. API 0066]